jgi:uncharacterized protein (AIM24 family)
VQVRTRHTPTFGVARLVLAPGETVQSSSRAMLATSYGVTVDRAAHSPTFRGLARTWRDATVFTAPTDGGWVDLAAGPPGDLYSLELDGAQGWCVARSGWLAAASPVGLDPAWPGFRAMFGGDVGFLAHAAGIGQLLLCCAGAVDLVTLAPGELITLAPGHLVAYPDTVQTRLRAVSQSGGQSVRTGEGLALDFAGPAQLVTQTRDPRALAGWLAAHQPEGR